MLAHQKSQPKTELAACKTLASNLQDAYAPENGVDAAALEPYNNHKNLVRLHVIQERVVVVERLELVE